MKPKVYADIQEAGKELYNGRYGCLHSSEPEFDTVHLYEPDGKLVDTYHGYYWIWPSNDDAIMEHLPI